MSGNQHDAELFDPDEPNDVGDRRTVNGHTIELHDPDGRLGLVWNCDDCGMWSVSVVNFEEAPCGDTPSAESPNPDEADPGDYLRAIEGGETALHVTLSDDKEWWLAHNPDEAPPGTLNGPWPFWSTYPTGPWELQFCRREVMLHLVDELYYVDYDGEEHHSVHEIEAVSIADAPGFVRGEFDDE